jgi:pyruvate formate lyase activating enzyme
MRSGLIFDIKEFAVHDGPGIRTTIFMKGCPLRCAWCHNPEGLRDGPEMMRGAGGERMAGRWIRSDELAAVINRQARILREAEGGVTFSGGEPLSQADFVAETIDQLEDLNVLLDTSGYGAEEDFVRVAERCDLVYFDVKLIDDEIHQRHTGQSNRLILGNLERLSALGIPFVIRVPLVPGITDTAENLGAIAALAKGLAQGPNGLLGVELLPYNRAAGAKYAACGRSFEPGIDESRPVSADMAPFKRLGIPVRVV